jgi:hypothetical protein
MDVSSGFVIHPTSLATSTTRYNQVFQHRFRKFIKNISEKSSQTKNIATYFDLTCKPNEHLSIILQKHPQKSENCIVLSLEFIQKKPMEQLSLSLPMELIQKIYSYLSYEYIHVSFMITFTDEYPFVPPKWSLMDEKNNVSSSMLYMNNITFRDYFQSMIESHNERFKCIQESILSEYNDEIWADMNENQRKRIMDHYHWSPVITIEKDVLCFLTRIHHFEYLVD